MVPVLRNAHAMGIAAIGAEIRRLAEAARGGHLHAERPPRSDDRREQHRQLRVRGRDPAPQPGQRGHGRDGGHPAARARRRRRRRRAAGLHALADVRPPGAGRRRGRPRAHRPGLAAAGRRVACETCLHEDRLAPAVGDRDRLRARPGRRPGRRDGRVRLPAGRRHEAGRLPERAPPRTAADLAGDRRGRPPEDGRARAALHPGQGAAPARTARRDPDPGPLPRLRGTERSGAARPGRARDVGREGRLAGPAHDGGRDRADRGRRRHARAAPTARRRSPTCSDRGSRA